MRVINWCDHAVLTKDVEPSFYLERDNWDDNYYKTSYHLHLSGNLTDDGNPLWIGEVKILRKGQRREDTFQLETGKLDFLDFRFCSLGQSLDYYQRLSQLDEDLRRQVLSALRDIAIFPEFKRTFEYEDGLEVSLYHFLEPDDDLFTLGPAMISGDFSDIADHDVEFKFKDEEVKQAVAFSFALPDHKYGDPEEPQIRINVITGAEDSGKDRFLAKLARHAFASNEDRDLLEGEGYLDPVFQGFTRVVCLSYSPTITFRIPALYVHEKEQIVREMKKCAGRFIYCGNHDLEKEMHEALQFFNIDTDGRVWEFEVPAEADTFFKSNEELTDEFVIAMETIALDYPKRDLLDDLFAFMNEVPDLQFIINIDFPRLREQELATFFQNLAGESQILLHSAVHLILSVTPRSLVLFNAPETYLRPTLVSLLLKYATHLLHAQNAGMIVATESVEVLRETKSANITIFRRAGNTIEPIRPEIETYGETNEVISEYLKGVYQKNDSGDVSASTEPMEDFIQNDIAAIEVPDIIERPETADSEVQTEGTVAIDNGLTTDESAALNNGDIKDDGEDTKDSGAATDGDR